MNGPEQGRIQTPETPILAEVRQLPTKVTPHVELSNSHDPNESTKHLDKIGKYVSTPIIIRPQRQPLESASLQGSNSNTLIPDADDDDSDDPNARVKLKQSDS